jgi:hypothetical protein
LYTRDLGSLLELFHDPERENEIFGGYNMSDLLPALKGQRFPRPFVGGSSVPPIYSGLHLSFGGQSGWPEIPQEPIIPGSIKIKP